MTTKKWFAYYMRPATIYIASTAVWLCENIINSLYINFEYFIFHLKFIKWTCKKSWILMLWMDTNITLDKHKMQYTIYFEKDSWSAIKPLTLICRTTTPGLRQNVILFFWQISWHVTTYNEEWKKAGQFEVQFDVVSVGGQNVGANVKQKVFVELIFLRRQVDLSLHQHSCNYNIYTYQMQSVCKGKKL